LKIVIYSSFIIITKKTFTEARPVYLLKWKDARDKQLSSSDAFIALVNYSCYYTYYNNYVLL